MRLGSAESVGLIGLKAFLIHVQSFISPGLPYFSIIGLPDASLSESRERVKSACSACGFRWPQTRVTVNMSPASKPKHGSSHDLAIATSVLEAGGALPTEGLEHTVILGELNLDGTILPINGLLPILTQARAQGITRAFVPADNLDEARLVPDIEVVGLRHLGQLIQALGGRSRVAIPEADTRQTSDKPTTIVRAHPRTGQHEDNYPADVDPTPPKPDMADVIGQEETKCAMMVAAAGGHHMLMVGPPGAGKSMLAERLPSIMPALDAVQQLEVASIRSLCGTLGQYGITDVPPFEAPHHTISMAAMVGGGAGLATPGAITRAHRGVLFMDEAPEFSPRVIQSLREPLEIGRIFLSRAKGSTTFPARFQLVMAANPCPCGYGYGTGERCTCTPRERLRYWNRLSGPIMDRIDIQTTVPPVTDPGFDDHRPRQHSAQIRKRVTRARQTAKERFRKQGWTCNAQISGEWLRQNTSAKARSVVDQALRKQRISLRGADRTMRLAWTLADLDGRTSPDADDVTTGILLRTRAV